ncbi:MAG: hypothetical protein KAI55_03860 [Candidatus Aenigmarchaeota archaeon]|nr:hypothetical protein [Candidatus Aenigmarchaeota archaeon]
MIPAKKHMMAIIGIIVITMIFVFGYITEQKNQQKNDCTVLKQSFDDSIKKLNLPADGSNPDYFCAGLYPTSNFSKLEPKWAVAKLEKKRIDENTIILSFKGIDETEIIWFTTKNHSKYKEGDYYKIDMYNFCRFWYSMLSSSTETSSEISSTIIEPEKIVCKQ